MRREKHDTMQNAVWLQRDRIRASATQPRKFFDTAEMRDLSASIRTHGLLQPILVRYAPSAVNDAAFQIVAGERRYRASEGILDVLPCLITDVSPQQLTHLALVENIQRRDLTALEEAQAIAAMMTEQQLSANAVARALGKSAGWVNNRLSLLKTGKDVQAVAARQPLAMSSLLLIDSVTDDAGERAELLEAVEQGASHVAIKQRVEAVQALKRSKSNRAPDTHTQQRMTLNQQNGGGNVSRGRIVTGSNRQQARTIIKDTVGEIERHIKTLKAWKQYLPAEEFARAVGRLQAQIDGLRDE